MRKEPLRQTLSDMNEGLKVVIQQLKNVCDQLKSQRDSQYTNQGGTT